MIYPDLPTGTMGRSEGHSMELLLTGGDTAIHQIGLTGQELRSIRGAQQHQAHQILKLTDAAHRDTLDKRLTEAGNSLALISVLMNVGPSALTVMPYCANSQASCLVGMLTAPLEAA